MMLSFIVLCIVVGYCIRYRSKKRESERDKVNIHNLDQPTADSPIHHDVQPIIIRELKAATLNPHEEHLKTDTITTGGTHDYAPTRKQFSDGLDLFIPQYASTVASTEEIPPFEDTQHLAPQQYNHHHINREHNDDQQMNHIKHMNQRNHHRRNQHQHHKQRRHNGHNHKHDRNRNRDHQKFVAKSKGRNKYRQAVQEDEEHDYGYGHDAYGHHPVVVEDEDVIRYNDRDDFIR